MSILRRIRNKFSRSKLEQEIDAEIKSHIEMRIADNVASGMSPEEARRDALIRFGNRTTMRERVTEEDAGMVWDCLGPRSDLRGASVAPDAGLHHHRARHPDSGHRRQRRGVQRAERTGSATARCPAIRRPLQRRPPGNRDTTTSRIRTTSTSKPETTTFRDMAVYRLQNRRADRRQRRVQLLVLPRIRKLLRHARRPARARAALSRDRRTRPPIRALHRFEQ